MTGNMDGDMPGPGPAPGRGPGRGPGHGPGRGPAIVPGRVPGLVPGRGPVPVPGPGPDGGLIGPGPYRRPLNIYMCRETDSRTARQFCYYTVAYADALFPPKIECSQFVAGPFYTMAECDSYIVTRFGVSRGQYF